MGACTFYTEASGKTASEAFKRAVDQALYDYGHAGYTGTIAEKREFTLIRDKSSAVLTRYRGSQNERAYITEGLIKGDAGAIAEALLDLDDSRVNDKWGPAGCIDLGNGEWLFFGHASS